MGYYLNPGDGSEGAKTEWLNEHAEWINTYEQADIPASYKKVPEGKALICRIDNRIFSAVGIIYGPQEYRAFTDPYDSRHKVWYLADKEDIEKEVGEIPWE